ncbi:MAG: hypothetical protein A2Y58_00570 [Chloroflexi bacterium RBG_13_51_52]|nr:MAG: hypothetical protein A2Y58_00570 [Chloroflexi bacterium RBG_13_51_52]
MKKILDKTGLVLMILDAIFTVVGFLVLAFVTNGMSVYSIGLFVIIVLPAVVFTLITFKDRLLGGLLATVVPALLLVPVCIGIANPESSPSSYIFFAVLVCLLLGGTCILVSLAMRPRGKAKAAA